MHVSTAQNQPVPCDYRMYKLIGRHYVMFETHVLTTTLPIPVTLFGTSYLYHNMMINKPFMSEQSTFSNHKRSKKKIQNIGSVRVAIRYAQFA